MVVGGMIYKINKQIIVEGTTLRILFSLKTKKTTDDIGRVHLITDRG